MITAELEGPRDGTGPDFFDSTSLDFCDAVNELFGLVRVTRFPGLSGLPKAAQTRATVVLFAGGDLVAQVEQSLDRDVAGWDRMEVDGLTTAIESPLERWSLSLATPEVSFQLEAVAVSPPLDLTEQTAGPLVRAAGVSRYDQVCELVGQVELGGGAGPISLRCIGERTHAWGAYDWSSVESVRSLYAAGAEQAVTVAAARPAGSAGHGEELRVGHLVEPSAEPHVVDDVRISTVYDSAHVPKSADLELRLADEEFPLRVAGEAACGLRLEERAARITVSFFRWSLEGAPALGRYEAVEPT
jgi:hypothetical protein